MTVGILRWVFPLEVGLVVSEDALASVHDVLLPSVRVRLHLPRLDEGGGWLNPPAEFDRISGDLLPSGTWGQSTLRTGSGSSEPSQYEVDALGFSAQVSIGQEAELSNGYPRGHEDVVVECARWLDRLTLWLGLLVNQPLDVTDPAPAILNPSLSSPISWISLAGQESWLSSQPTAPIQVVVPSDDDVAEGLVDQVTLRRAIKAANDQSDPPLSLAQLALARLAVQRGRHRQAIGEVGTGVEAVLTQALGLPVGHLKTLGGLVTDAGKKGLSLPADCQASLIEPRNDAVHRGVSPGRETVLRAVGILWDLMATFTPADAPPRGLPRAHRPQRFDLHLITPPHNHSA